MDKDIICIVCPNGCRMKAEKDAYGTVRVSGNRCPRGESFASAEMTAPMRTVTTTVATAFRDMPYLPVRTCGEIPAESVKTILKELSKIVIKKPVMCGDTVVRNVAGTGTDVIATMDMRREEEDGTVSSDL